MIDRFPPAIATTDGPPVQLSQRCRALEAANQSLTAEVAQLRRERDELRAHLATLAHDLRNPLAPVRNAVHLLRLRHDDADKVDSAARLIDRQVGCMSRVIDHLLESGRVDADIDRPQALRRLVDQPAVISPQRTRTEAASGASVDLRIRLRELAARQSARAHAHHDGI